MSSKTKLIVGVLIALVAIAAAVIIILLVTGDGKNNAPLHAVALPPETSADDTDEDPDDSADQADPDIDLADPDEDTDDPGGQVPSVDTPDNSDPKEIPWERLIGYWVTDEYPFVGFRTKTNGDREFEYGLFQTSFGYRGKVVDVEYPGNGETVLSVFFAAVPPNELDGGSPERTEKIRFKFGSLDADGTIEVWLAGIDGGVGWFTFEYGGATLEEAFDYWYYA